MVERVGLESIALCFPAAELNLIDRVRSLDIWVELGEELLLLLRQEESAEMLQASD